MPENAGDVDDKKISFYYKINIPFSKITDIKIRNRLAGNTPGRSRCKRHRWQKVKAERKWLLKMLQIAVCDDEKSMGEYLRELIDRRLSGREDYCVSVFWSGETLLCEAGNFDIFFLDIDLKDMSGIDMARRIRQVSEAVIVFVTALKEYVFDAFDVHAFQYLLKPINEEKFFQVLDHAVAQCLPAKEKEPLVIRVKGIYRNIPKENILYAENEARKVALHLGEEQVSYYAKMGELEGLLGDSFFRCHRGYLVNLGAVKGYDTGSIQLKNGETILMAKQKYSAFVEAYMEFLRRKT